MRNHNDFLTNNHDDALDGLAERANTVKTWALHPGLDLVLALHIVRTNAEYLLDDAVAQARDEGATWEQIAGRLQVTKQAVQQRYGA